MATTQSFSMLVFSSIARLPTACLSATAHRIVSLSDLSESRMIVLLTNAE